MEAGATEKLGGGWWVNLKERRQSQTLVDMETWEILEGPGSLTMSRRAWHVGVAPKGNLAWPADGFNLDSHIKGKELWDLKYMSFDVKTTIFSCEV